MVGIAILAVPSLLALCMGHFIGASIFIVIGIMPFCGEIRIAQKYQRILNLLGDISFPLYLFHIPVMALLMILGVRATAPMAAASFLVATAALYGIDYPARALFSRLIRFSAIAGMRPDAETERTIVL